MKEKHQVIALFVISSILSPLSFVLCLCILGSLDYLGPGLLIVDLGRNVSTFNWGIFILFTTLGNFLWFMMQYCIIRLFRKIDIFLFLKSKTSSLGLWLGNMINLAQLSMWVDGMEGNVMGFIGFPILLLALVIWGITDIINFIKAACGKCDSQHKVEEKNDANTLTLRLLPNLKLPALLLVIIFMITNIQLLLFAAFYLLDLLGKLIGAV